MYLVCAINLPGKPPLAGPFQADRWHEKLSTINVFVAIRRKDQRQAGASSREPPWQPQSGGEVKSGWRLQLLDLLTPILTASLSHMMCRKNCRKVSSDFEQKTVSIMMDIVVQGPVERMANL